MGSYATYKADTQESNAIYWKDRAERAEDAVRQLATMLSAAREPSGLISAAADTYPYAKAEVLEKAERILTGLPEPTSGNCGHCAQPYGLQTKLTLVEGIGKTHSSWGCSKEFSDGWKACREQLQELLF